MLKPALEVLNRNAPIDVDVTPGIRVGSAADLAQVGRLMISSGSQTAAVAGLADKYVPGAWVPRAPWRVLTKAEITIVGASSIASAPGATLEILSPDGREARAAAHKAIALGTQLSTGKHDATEQFIGGLIDAAGDLLRFLTASATRRFRCASTLRLAMSGAGLLTTTRDPSQGNRLLGLHVDSHEKKPLPERVLSRRLLAINLTPEPRALLFVNLPLEQMGNKMLSLNSSHTGAANNATDLGRAFMAHAPNYPVLRLILDPGEAYLAPVQNMIHDGCTDCRRHTDVIARAFGEYERWSIEEGLSMQPGEASHFPQ